MKLRYRRGTARRTMSVEILSIYCTAVITFEMFAVGNDLELLKVIGLSLFYHFWSVVTTTLFGTVTETLSRLGIFPKNTEVTWH